MTVESAPTIREALESAYDETIAPALEQSETPPAAPAETVPETPEQKDTRARDEAGRFVEKKEDKKEEVKAKPSGVKPADPAAPVQEKLGVKRPDSWKKELWPVWDKLDAGEVLTKEERKMFLEYLPQREGEYQKGVSTYKQEWDRARPLIEAVAPYQPFLAQHNMKPEQFVAALAQSDQVLRYGNPQQKLQMFARLAQDYQIPIHEMLVQGEDGKVYLNQQYTQPAAQPQNLSPENVQQMVAKTLQDQMWITAIRNFVVAKDKDGSPAYPHFDQFKTTMDGLLRSGVVTGATPDEALKNAYDATLRLPQNATLFEAHQKQEREAEEALKRKEEADRAKRARDAAPQVKGSTPTGPTDGGGKKSIRQALEAAYDQHIGGRV